MDVSSDLVYIIDASPINSLDAEQFMEWCLKVDEGRAVSGSYTHPNHYSVNISRKHFRYMIHLCRLDEFLNANKAGIALQNAKDAQIILDLEAENDRLRNRILELEMALNP